MRRPKNHAFTTIATSAAQYSEILDQVTAHGGTTLELRRRLAGEAFAHTARYDRAIADFFAGATAEGPFPGTVTITLTRKAVLRYGENPHQQAALYARPDCRGASVVAARQLHGKELSYNNLLDLDSALAIVRQFSEPAAVVIKHNNPCGAAVADTLAVALQRAMDGDPLSAFGSVLGLNRTVDAATAEVLAAPGLFVEAIVAPRLRRRRPGNPHHQAQVEGQRAADGGRRRWTGRSRTWTYRCLDGGVLVQEADVLPDPEDDLAGRHRGQADRRRRWPTCASPGRWCGT